MNPVINRVPVVASLMLVALAPVRLAAAAASPSLAVAPQAQSAAQGATVSVTAQVGGAPGSQQISYVVVGRNDGVHGTVTTDATGAATISYRDHGAGSSKTSDTIAVIDQAQNLSATATVDYLDGSSYADHVALDATGSGTADDSCGTAGEAAGEVPLAGVTEVCAAVGNELGEPLAGKPVDFAVSDGDVGPADGTLPRAAAYQTVTDRAGVAYAAVTSTVPGAQAVTAAADRITGRASLQYAQPGPDTAATVSLAPANTYLIAGHPRRFVAAVTDQYGNPVAGVSVGFARTGQGSLAAGASAVTGSHGSASVLVSSRRGHLGPGALSATIPAAQTMCGSAGTCAARVSYDVIRRVVPTSFVLEAAPGATAGAVELVAAVLTDAAGRPARGQVVAFRVTGANSASGTVRSNARGVALFGYRARRAGPDRARAWQDGNRDGKWERGELRASLRLVVARRRSGDPPKK